MRSPEAVREVSAYQDARPQDGAAAEAGLSAAKLVAAIRVAARNNPEARALKGIEVKFSILLVKPAWCTPNRARKRSRKSLLVAICCIAAPKLQMR